MKKANEKIELNIGETLSTKQLAKTLGWHEMTLAKMRQQGRGIPYLKLGRRVIYRKADVEAYLVNGYVGKPLASV